jgi:hypothetical protein
VDTTCTSRHSLARGLRRSGLTQLTSVVALSGLAIFGACSSSSKGTEDAGENGEGGPIVQAGCPSVIPANGSSCTGAASCLYGNVCDESSAVCTGAQWIIGPDVAPDGGNCPASAPDDGSNCPACMVAKHCAYNPACDEDGGPTVTASCISTAAGDAWKVVADECEPQDAPDAEGGTVVGAEIAEAGDAAASEAGDAAAADSGD